MLLKYTLQWQQPKQAHPSTESSFVCCGAQVAGLQAEAKDSEVEAERQRLQLEEAREEGDRLHGQIVEVRLYSALQSGVVCAGGSVMPGVCMRGPGWCRGRHLISCACTGLR